MDEIIKLLETQRDSYSHHSELDYTYNAFQEAIDIVKPLLQNLKAQLAESELRAQLLAETLEAINERDRWRSVETEPPIVGEKYECRNPIWDFTGARQYTYYKEGFGFVNINNVFVLPNIEQPTLYRQRRPV